MIWWDWRDVGDMVGYGEIGGILGDMVGYGDIGDMVRLDRHGGIGGY